MGPQGRVFETAEPHLASGRRDDAGAVRQIYAEATVLRCPRPAEATRDAASSQRFQGPLDLRALRDPRGGRLEHRAGRLGPTHLRVDGA